MTVEVHFIGILLSGIASMAVGFLWYSPMLFAKQWMELTGISEKDIKTKQKEMGKLYAVSFLLSLMTAYVLSHVIFMSRQVFGYPPVATGLTSAFWMWAGFVLPVQMNDYIYQGSPFKLILINTGYQLTTLLVVGIIVGLM